MWQFVCPRSLRKRCIVMPKRWIWTLLLAAAMATGLAGCGEQADTHPASPDAAHHYEILGTVVSVDASGKTAVIDHEKIADLMDAMTMSWFRRRRTSEACTR